MIDVTDESFEREVIERSTQVPVVVDLWAEWCGPCRTLGPVLERVVAATGGKVALAKVDVDSNPRVSATFQVRSIPAVYALRDRKVVDSFVGALPEPAVAEFVARLAPPESEADRLVATGDEESLRRALELEPAHEDAILGLARILIDRGDHEEALTLLNRLPDAGEVHRLSAEARLGLTGAPPSDGIEARLDGLLERVKDDELARREFLDLLEVLGADDPRTPRYRRALTARLY